MTILAPGGALAQAIPHYEDRPEQRAMSEAVSRALDDGRPLIVEAGTGTGKTLAYLVPALQSGKRVVVSTGTRALQDQIARHDIPLLRTIVARPFTAVVLKGVNNYVCRRRLGETRDPLAAELRDWAEHTETGDRAEVEWLPESSPLWTEVTTTPDARIGPRCPYFERCFVTQARRLAEKADLILVNHHLYFADRALRANHPGVARAARSRRGDLRRGASARRRRDRALRRAHLDAQARPARPRRAARARAHAAVDRPRRRRHDPDRRASRRRAVRADPRRAARRASRRRRPRPAAA
jgi:Rad3-related DNA helicase